jgi:ribosome-associated protein
MSTKDDLPNEYDGPSRSQLKRDSEALQKLGRQLAEARNDILAKCDLPDTLRAALDEYRKLTANGALRRQLQYIGRLMRDLSEANVEQIKAQFHSNVELEKKQFHQLEQLRDRLVAGDKDALAEVIATYPDADIQQLRQLIRQAGKEHEQGASPAGSRKLFKLLRELQEQSPP